jgi:thiol-disulfide isomerase/thioredoxin
MKRKILLIILPVFMLACKTLFPGSAPVRRDPVIAPVTPNWEISTPRPTVKNKLPAPIGSGYTLVRLHPKDGKLVDLLAAEVKKAEALNQLPAVEFDATWCPPCKAIAVSLDEKNELMIKAFDGTYIIHLDVDEWGFDMLQYGFSFDGIPVFFKLDSSGRPNGEVIDGNAWGDNIPENMAPPLDQFFHNK